MEIRKIGEKTILISTSKAKVVIWQNGVDLKKYEPDIILSGKFEGAFSINTPGEYETKEVWVLSMPMDVNEFDKNNIYVITADEIRIAFLGAGVKELTKKQIEKVGIIDVIICNLEGDLKLQLKNISEIDPQVLIPIGDSKEQLESISKELGIKAVEETKKYKLNYDEFQKDDYQLKLIKFID